MIVENIFVGILTLTWAIWAGLYSTMFAYILPEDEPGVFWFGFFLDIQIGDTEIMGQKNRSFGTLLEVLFIYNKSSTYLRTVQKFVKFV